MSAVKLTKIQQRFNTEHIEDIAGTVLAQMSAAQPAIKPGGRIAIAVGSRGIANVQLIVRTVVQYVRERGGRPFIVPAMGSHGGASAQGQQAVLAGYGITEEGVGAPVRASMEVVQLPGDGLSSRVFMDKLAYESDGTIVINRVKVHTDFHGIFESGLMKMCVIGLGKHAQALEIHRFGTRGLRELIPLTARQVLKHGNILLGVGIVENAYDQIMKISAVKPADFEETEKQLLSLSRENMPSLPVDRLDILLVDRMGKDISGTGMDTNIIGRMDIRKEPEPERPDISCIIVCGLTEASHGNAIGIGLADITTRRLFDQIDLQATYENSMTSTFLARAKIPLITQDVRQALQYACRVGGSADMGGLRILRIRDTLHLSELYASDAVLWGLQNGQNIRVIGEPAQMIGPDGELLPF